MAWKKEQEKNMELKKRVFKAKFEAYAVRWTEENRSDDRGLFVRMFNKIIPEIDAMKKVKSNYINVAFNRSVMEDVETMLGIVRYFTGRQTRDGTFTRNPEPMANLYWERAEIEEGEYPLFNEVIA